MVRESDESLGTERLKERLKDVITKIVRKRKLSVFHNDVTNKESVQILTIRVSNQSCKLKL